jgi:hypothetical protein
MPPLLQILFVVACALITVVPLAVSGWIAMRETDRALAEEPRLKLAEGSAEQTRPPAQAPSRSGRQSRNSGMISRP